MTIQRFRYALLGLLVIGLCLIGRPTGAAIPAATSAVPQTTPAASDPIDRAESESAQTLEQRAQALYEAGQLSEAISLLQRAIQQYQAQHDSLRQAVALSNLALVYQQAGQNVAANQAMASGLQLIDQVPGDPTRQQVLAQALNIQGRLQLAQGQAEAALTSWEQATALYQQLADQTGELQTRLNQAQALKALGLYRRAIIQLEDLSHLPSPQPLLTATILRSLGDALQISGDLPRSRQTLEQALQFLATLPATATPAEMAATQLSLANLTRVEAAAQLSLSGFSAADLSPETGSQQPAGTSRTLAETALQQRQAAAAQQFIQQSETALRLYQQVAQQSVVAETQVQAQLNQLNTLIELQRWTEAETVLPTVQAKLNTIPINQTSIYQRINLAIDWMQIDQAQRNVAAQNPTYQNPEINPAIVQLLLSAVQQATELGDGRARSFALGNLGKLYEQARLWADAKQTTEQALILAQSINAADVAYRWQWQLGRILRSQGNRSEAIVDYTEAIKSLQSLRNDLVAINREVQFSFQAQVEPVYREFVDLLLSTQPGIHPALADLVQARQVIEGLQIAELDNFFREACLETQFEIDRVVDRANLSAAIFYTIVLPDRLEVILKLPQRDLIRYKTVVPQSTVEATVDQFLAEIKRPYLSQQLRGVSQQVYDWLIRPAGKLLRENQIETLVFVLDNTLRNLPIAALSDGQNFLIENYSVALAPGLQLTDPKPLQDRRFNVLLAALSEARANFSPLNFVAQEVKEIQAEVPSKLLFNQTFTEENLRKQLDASSFSIVHIATHGQFSSNAADTFILAWDRPINVNELSGLLQTEEITDPEPIELLVLSACRTAVGDRHATLGMAGVAVRAGARSTIASLWNLDDDSGAVLMDQFYQALVQNRVSKAEALRRAQQALLESPRYSAPRFWAAYILLGNWL